MDNNCRGRGSRRLSIRLSADLVDKTELVNTVARGCPQRGRAGYARNRRRGVHSNSVSAADYSSLAIWMTSGCLYRRADAFSRRLAVTTAAFSSRLSPCSLRFRRRDRYCNRHQHKTHKHKCRKKRNSSKEGRREQGHWTRTRRRRGLRQQRRDSKTRGNCVAKTLSSAVKYAHTQHTIHSQTLACLLGIQWWEEEEG